MTDEAVLGIDVGTTSVKVVLIADNGEVVAEAASDPIPTAHPEPGAAEQDPADIWAALVQGVCSATAAAPGHRPVAVAMAAQSGSLVPVDTDGVAGPAMLWMDTRAKGLVESWDAQTRSKIRAISGWSASAGLGLSSLAWLLQERANRTWVRFASVDDFIMHQLTGRWITNPSNAAGMQMMDVATHAWSPELCEIAGATVDQLSLVAAAGDLVEPASGAGLNDSGLPPETPVFVGGHDQACAAYGLGVQDPGSVLLSAGTAWVVTAPTDQPAISTLPSNVNLSPHVRTNRWTVSQSLGGLGAMIEWWRSDAYEDPAQLDEDLSTAAPSQGAPFFVPALAEQQRTTWGRFQPSHPPDRATAARAVVESAGFEVRRALAALSTTVGRPHALTLVGGATSSGPLVQVLADTVGLPIQVPAGGSWPGRGAAKIAAEAIGWSPTGAASDSPLFVHPLLIHENTIDRRFDAYCRLVANDTERGNE